MSLPDELAGPLSREWARLAPLVTRAHWVAATGSTMDLAQAMSSDGREGLLVIADEQTAGRGRRGREWSSPPGAGLYFSLLLRPPVSATLKGGPPQDGVGGGPPQDGVGGPRFSVATEGAVPGPSVIGLLTLAAGVGVVDGVAAATGLPAQLKWPNDLLVGRRKLAGILAEGVAVGTPEQAVVLGVGLNVSSSAYPPDVATRATSIESELGRPIDRGEVLVQTLVGIAHWYRALLEARYDDVLRAWRAAAPSANGAAVQWTTAAGPQSGVTAGVDESGALLVRTPHGMERLIAGEVTWTL